jgi:hypothetical protein
VGPRSLEGDGWPFGRSATLYGNLSVPRRSAAERYQLPPEILLAIASRETNMRNIIGDGGHGYGIMQIDDRSFPEWCNSGLWKDVNAAIQKGALDVLKRAQVFRKLL